MTAPIPRNRSSIVCLRQGQLLTVRATDPSTSRQYFFLPGGAIEPGETPSDAAVRETLEETGYVVKTIGQPLVLEYTFNWGGKEYACQTNFFRAELTDPHANDVRPTLPDPDMHEAVWVDLADIDKTFEYHPGIRAMVRKLLEAQAK